MSYLKEYEWELVPKNLPVINKKCPKCSTKTHFINTERFRVNANKNKIDIWMIYQCETCKSTWNLSIYSRITPNDIPVEDYAKFQSNDIWMIRKCAFDQRIFTINKVEVVMEDVDFEVIKREIGEIESLQSGSFITISSPSTIPLRLDKLLSDHLQTSRGNIKKMIQENLIYSLDGRDLQKAKIIPRLRIFISTVD